MPVLWSADRLTDQKFAIAEAVTRAEAVYTLEYAEPDAAIRKNRHAVQSPHNPMMFEREARVFELLMAEGLFER